MGDRKDQESPSLAYRMSYGGKHCTINWTFIILVNYWQCQIVADFYNVISKVEFKTSHLHLLRVV